MKTWLIDSWNKQGSNPNEFREAIKELSDNTKELVEPISALQILSVIPQNQSPSETGLYVAVSSQETLASRGKSMRTFRVDVPSTLSETEEFTSLLGETRKNTGFLLRTKNPEVKRDRGSSFFFSQAALGKLALWGLSGDAVTRPANNQFTFDRDNFIMSQLSADKRKSGKIKLIYREDNGMKKIFSLASSRYSLVAQTILSDIYDTIVSDATLGRAECKSWMVTHNFSQMVVVFPDKGKEICETYDVPDNLVPGIILETSDMGESSITIRGCWFHGNSASVQSSVSRRHVGTVDVAQIMKNVEETIFANYTKLPERLCEIMLDCNLDPSVDILTAYGQAANREAIDATIDTVAEQIGLSAAISVARSKELIKELKAEFSDCSRHSGYDFALKFLDLPDRVTGLNTTQKKNLEKAVGRAPYVDYKNIKATHVSLR